MCSWSWSTKIRKTVIISLTFCFLNIVHMMVIMMMMIGLMVMMIISDRQTDTDTLEWRRCSKTRKSRKTSNQMSTPVLLDILNIIIILIVLIIMMIIKGVCPMLRLSFCRMAAERFHMFLQEWTVVPLPPLHSEHFLKDGMIKSCK